MRVLVIGGAERLGVLGLGVLGLGASLLCGCGSGDADSAAGSEVSSPAPAGAGAGGVVSGAGGTGTPSQVSDDEVVGGFDTSNVVVDVPPTPEEQAACEPNLTGIVRDFRGADEPMGHADFETFAGGSASPGIVQPTLGADKKPVYAPPGMLMDPQNGQQTTTKLAYDQWYRDTPGVNESMQYLVQLLPGVTPGILTFDDATFFPIDGLIFGNSPGENHNYHFTFELHTEFSYNGGEVFTFTGDDDLWVFINNHLAIDLGGLHPEVTDTVALDAVATQFGITVGNTYPLDLFHAERHTTESHFRIDTSIEFTNCEPIIILR